MKFTPSDVSSQTARACVRFEVAGHKERAPNNDGTEQFEQADIDEHREQVVAHDYQLLHQDSLRSSQISKTWCVS